MNKVQQGNLSLQDAVRIIRNSHTRERAITELTRRYDPETVEALQFFRLL